MVNSNFNCLTTVQTWAELELNLFLGIFWQQLFPIHQFQKAPTLHNEFITSPQATSTNSSKLGNEIRFPRIRIWSYWGPNGLNENNFNFYEFMELDRNLENLVFLVLLVLLVPGTLQAKTGVKIFFTSFSRLSRFS